jgi:hypothetical protein
MFIRKSVFGLAILSAVLLSVLLFSCGDLDDGSDGSIDGLVGGGDQPVLIYGFTLSETTHTFNSVPEGIYEPQTVDVTVTNTGDIETGVITIGITGDDAEKFTLSTVSLDSIASAGNDTFSVSTTTGLSMGAYTATITATGATGNGEDSTFNETFTVLFTVGDPILELQIASSGQQQQQQLQFEERIAGYTAAPAAQVITVENTGTQTLTGVAVNGGPAYIGTPTTANIPAGSSATFSVQPKMGLASGSYPAILTVGTALASAEFEAAFSVRNGRITTNSPVTNGTMTVNLTSAAPSAQVTVTVTPNTNYVVRPTGFTPTTVNFTKINATQYQFMMPPNTDLTVGTEIVHLASNPMGNGGTIDIVNDNGTYKEVHTFTYNPGRQTNGQTAYTLDVSSGTAPITANVIVVAGGGGGGGTRDNYDGWYGRAVSNDTTGGGGGGTGGFYGQNSTASSGAAGTEGIVIV